MPNYKRQEIKFVSRGLCLSKPPDLLEDGVPYSLNMRQYYNGAYANRPGVVAVNTVPLDDLTVHSIIRLNNYVFGGFSRFLGAGDSLYSNTSVATTFTERASGFSGAPLQFSVVRPPQSPEPWLYIGDELQSGKARVDGTFYEHGIAPPTVAPYAQPAATAYKIIDDFEAIGSWTNGGTASAITAVTRVATSISQIVYDEGTTGWATVAPAALDESIQPGMLLLVNALETVLVESVSEAVTTTTISSIQYVSGTTGLCTIQLATPTDKLARDSMLYLNSSEVVRVLSVTYGPDGLPSFQCSTVGTHAAGETVVGLRSFRAFLVNTYTTETLTSNYLQTTVASGVGYISLTATLDLSSLNGRPITDLDDMHISILIDKLEFVTEGRIELDVDANTNDFTRNYFYKAFRANDLTAAVSNEITTLQANQRVLQRSQIDSGVTQKLMLLDSQLPEIPEVLPVEPLTPTTQTVLGASQWTELRFKINPQELIRVGSDSSRSLHDVKAIRIQLQTTDSVNLGVDAWWVGGTFGADSLPNVNLGAPYNYRYVYRSLLTGARSNPSPPMREGVIPRRQQVVGTVTPSTDPQVDQIEIYRTGGALTTIDNSPPWFYVMSISNDSPTFTDELPDDIVVRGRQLDFDNFQPFLDVDIPRSGTCNVVGTEVTRAGGDFFNTLWAPGVVIVINNVPYSLYNSPTSNSLLSLAESAGTQTGVEWFIPNPRLQAQPMPAMWGPFGGGTFNPVLFACGSTLQPGHIFWTKAGNPDANSQFGNLELTGPSEPLINGVIFRGQAYVFSSENLYLLTPAVDRGDLIFSGQRVAGNRGLFSRYALTVGDEGIFYLSRDGIYFTGGGESASITDEMLYPLFIHEGAPPVTTNGIVPPDFCRENDLRLIYGESVVYFDFVDTNGDRATLMFDIRLKGWFYYKYGPGVVCHYFEEGKNLSTLLMGGANGKLYTSSGHFDDGEDIPVAVWTPWFDGGDPRSNKQWANGMLDFAGCGVLVETWANFAQTQVGSQVLNSPGCEPEPPPEGNRFITQGGEFFITQGGDFFIQE